MVSLSKKVLALSGALFLSSSVFATQAGEPAPDLYIPDRMQVELIGGGDNYRAKITFNDSGKEVVLYYRVKVGWQFFYNGKFTFTRDKDYEK